MRAAEREESNAEIAEAQSYDSCRLFTTRCMPSTSLGTLILIIRFFFHSAVLCEFHVPSAQRQLSLKAHLLRGGAERAWLGCCSHAWRVHHESDMTGNIAPRRQAPSWRRGTMRRGVSGYEHRSTQASCMVTYHLCVSAIFGPRRGR